MPPGPPDRPADRLAGRPTDRSAGRPAGRPVGREGPEVVNEVNTESDTNTTVQNIMLPSNFAPCLRIATKQAIPGIGGSGRVPAIKNLQGPPPREV